MLVPQHVKEAMISEDGPFIQTEVLASRMVKPSLGGVSLHDLAMEELISCLIMLSPPRPILLSQVPEIKSNNTAEVSAMIEALSFLGPRGPVARDVESCIYYDSKHAAGVCLCTIQACTHVQLALACQRSMPCAQHRLRLTIQHVYGHTRNLGNECADHAAALGSLGLASSHNLAARWVRHIFDTSACCGGCNSIREILERLHRIRTEATSPPQDGFCVSLTYHFVSSVILLSTFFPAHPLCSSGKAMERPTSSFSTASASSFGEKFRAQHVESSPGIALSRADQRRICTIRRRIRLGPNCTLLSFCS